MDGSTQGELLRLNNGFPGKQYMTHINTKRKPNQI